MWWKIEINDGKSRLRDSQTAFLCSFSERNPPAVLVRIKILRYKEPPFAKMEAGSPTAPKAKGGFVDERHTKFNTF